MAGALGFLALAVFAISFLSFARRRLKEWWDHRSGNDPNSAQDASAGNMRIDSESEGARWRRYNYNEQLVKSAASLLLRRVSESQPDADSRANHFAWLAGASILTLTAITHVPSIRDAWGSGQRPEIAGLLWNFSLPMISRWHRYMSASKDDDGVSMATSVPGVADSSLELAWACGLAEEDRSDILSAVQKLDVQFNREHDWVTGLAKSPTPWAAATPYLGDFLQNQREYVLTEDQRTIVSSLHHYQQAAANAVELGLNNPYPPNIAEPPTNEPSAVYCWEYLLIMDLAKAGLGGTPDVDWSAQKYPITRHDDLPLIADPPELDAAILMGWFGAVATATAAMFHEYTMTSVGEE